MKSGAQEVGVTQRGEENKGGEGGKTGCQECLLRIRTMLEMTKVGCCDVVTSASEMGMMEGERDKEKEEKRLVLNFGFLCAQQSN